jgi:hypothetical protein
MNRSATDVGLVFSIKNRVSRILSVKSVLVGFFSLFAGFINHSIDYKVYVLINRQVV